MIAWSPAIDTAAPTIIRPVPWARPIIDLPFRPERWGDRLIRIAAPGGAHLFVHRHGAPELALWLPARLEPRTGESFGLYLHADRQHGDRMRAAAALLRRWLGPGTPPRPEPFAHAHRHATMLYVHDRQAAGTSLRDIAAELFDPMPKEWRASSERSDLRRLAETAAALIAGGYRALLGSSRDQS